LNTGLLPITELACPSRLSFSLVGGDGRIFSPLVKEGAGITAGQPLGSDSTGQVLASPVQGDVLAIVNAPDIRGARKGTAVLVQPAPDSSPLVFPALDPLNAPRASLMDRIKEAGLFTNSMKPVPLLEALRPDPGVGIDTLVLLAADRELEVNATLQLFRERIEDGAAAALLLARIAGAGSVMLAVPELMEKDAAGAAGRGAVKVLPIPAGYPDSLDPLVALRAGGGKGVRVVHLETALALLDAVRRGKVQDKKVLTVIGPNGKARGNYRVQLGCRLKELFLQVGLEPGEGDKVVAGGPMRGFAQYALDGSIDAGVDAVMLIKTENVIDWSDEPCVNCGACVDVCPVNLQIQLIGRYAEFGLFDRTEDLGLFHCIECGLCASVCTGRRPLVQFIRLAKEELIRKRAELERSRSLSDTSDPDAGQEPEEELGNVEDAESD
jgi:electron transport complex protein RnfC